jgi:hypothetical protein
MPEHIDNANTQQIRNFWEHHLEQWQKSGLSQLAYCREHQLKPNRFYYWRRRILKPQTRVSFLPVKLPMDTPPKPQLVRILMPNGCALELEGRDEPEQLERLVKMVAGL